MGSGIPVTPDDITKILDGPITQVCLAMIDIDSALNTFNLARTLGAKYSDASRAYHTRAAQAASDGKLAKKAIVRWWDIPAMVVGSE